MRISILTIGAVASIIAINSVFADTIVTSQSYVDNRDALKQDKIPVAGTNEDTPGETVVTYTDTAGTIGERRICDAAADENGDCDDDNLVTRDLLDDQIGNLGDQIDQVANLPTTVTTNKVCVAWEPGYENSGDDSYCILWDLVGKVVYGFPSCTTESDCDDFARSCPMRMAYCGGTPPHCMCHSGILE